MPVTVKVGVTWRRDGRDTAHQGDIRALQSVGDSEFIIDVYSLLWEGAPRDPKITLKEGKLEDMDVLVVPGGPHANQSQISLTLTKDFPEPKNTPAEKDKAYANARAGSELGLIERARYLGMPILAFCGGSWRLLQNYGGQTIEVGSLTMQGKVQTANRPVFNKELSQTHAGNMQLVDSEFKHGVKVNPASILGRAMTPPVPQPQQGPAVPASQRVPGGNVMLQANSVHWAVAREGTMGKLPKETVAPFPGIDPNGLLEINARDTGSASTVEGFEARSGAPVMGMQWHPEYMLPTATPVKGETDDQTKSRELNFRAIRYVLEAGAAYRVRRQSLDAIRQHFGGRFVAAESKGNIHFPEQTEGSGVRLADKKPAPPFSAKSVTTYLQQFKRNPSVLTWQEWTNMIHNRTLSHFIPPDEKPDYAALAQYINRNNGAAHFISKSDLVEAKKTLGKKT